ncbi:hypothetical protein BDK51DRAFT_40905 [Blyttiomyces helicus]|uniref:PHD-type domain-containing protein n=1 Tax=Blyttiomyces helicus TaxID=388810 RepID=A0A4P9WHM8_9FUNG|nr:hypothetical protein BDK51DRAFT_40905 [Blyttiomyces helicus]|eukprot:RKO92244.1 hypothetical protein BDK51DRAFT_40905 [Blyttiomyces helicus]
MITDEHISQPPDPSFEAPAATLAPYPKLPFDNYPEAASPAAYPFAVLHPDPFEMLDSASHPTDALLDDLESLPPPPPPTPSPSMSVIASPARPPADAEPDIVEKPAAPQVRKRLRSEDGAHTAPDPRATRLRQSSSPITVHSSSSSPSVSRGKEAEFESAGTPTGSATGTGVGSWRDGMADGSDSDLSSIPLDSDSDGEKRHGGLGGGDGTPGRKRSSAIGDDRDGVLGTTGASSKAAPIGRPTRLARQARAPDPDPSSLLRRKAVKVPVASTTASGEPAAAPKPRGRPRKYPRPEDVLDMPVKTTTRKYTRGASVSTGSSSRGSQRLLAAARRGEKSDSALPFPDDPSDLPPHAPLPRFGPGPAELMHTAPVVDPAVPLKKRPGPKPKLPRKTDASKPHGVYVPAGLVNPFADTRGSHASEESDLLGDLDLIRVGRLEMGGPSASDLYSPTSRQLAGNVSPQRASIRLGSPMAAKIKEDEEKAAGNDDYCTACLTKGRLLCCESCTKSFHFGCVEEGFSPDWLPEGVWECKECRSKRRPPQYPGPTAERLRQTHNPEASVYRDTALPQNPAVYTLFDELLWNLEGTNPRGFELPSDLKSSFTGFYTHPVTGAYIDAGETAAVGLARTAKTIRGVATRRGAASSSSAGPQTSLTATSVSALPPPAGVAPRPPVTLCFHCGKSGLKLPQTSFLLSHTVPEPRGQAPGTGIRLQAQRSELIRCDYCPLHWHLDCLDPPLAAIPPELKDEGTETVDVAAARELRARAWGPREAGAVGEFFEGAQPGDDDDTAAGRNPPATGRQPAGVLKLRRKWMCPCHASWVVPEGRRPASWRWVDVTEEEEEDEDEDEEEDRMEERQKRRTTVDGQCRPPAFGMGMTTDVFAGPSSAPCMPPTRDGRDDDPQSGSGSTDMDWEQPARRPRSYDDNDDEDNEVGTRRSRLAPCNVPLPPAPCDAASRHPHPRPRGKTTSSRNDGRITVINDPETDELFSRPLSPPPAARLCIPERRIKLDFIKKVAERVASSSAAGGSSAGIIRTRRAAAAAASQPSGTAPESDSRSVTASAPAKEVWISREALDRAFPGMDVTWSSDLEELYKVRGVAKAKAADSIGLFRLATAAALAEDSVVHSHAGPMHDVNVDEKEWLESIALLTSDIATELKLRAVSNAKIRLSQIAETPAPISTPPPPAAAVQSITLRADDPDYLALQEWKRIGPERVETEFQEFKPSRSEWFEFKNDYEEWKRARSEAAGVNNLPPPLPPDAFSIA